MHRRRFDVDQCLALARLADVPVGQFDGLEGGAETAVDRGEHRGRIRETP